MAVATTNRLPSGTNTSNVSQNRSLAIRETLENTLGVTISADWWSACCNAVSTVTEDVMLSHLLVSDLRDVVRPSAPSGSDASQKLQQAIRESRNAPSTNTAGTGTTGSSTSTSTSSAKFELPSTFQLLCQLEEAVDMSRTQESRLSYQDFNNQNRCLKLFLTDGIHNFVAMEVKPFLPSCKAGSKLRLQGPLTIRWGLLQLNHANATFIGGQVEELVVAQAKALEQAQKQGGVGVDATIRALIGNNPLEEDTAAIDEGEVESADVPEPVPVPAQIPPRIDPVGGMQPATAQPAATTPFNRPRNLPNSHAPTNTPITSTSDRSHRNPYDLHPQSAPNTLPTTRHGSLTTTPATSASMQSSSRSLATTTSTGTHTPLAPPPPRRTGASSNPYSTSTISSSRPSIPNDSSITFQQLRHILLQSIQDPTILRNNLSRTFQVTLIQKGGNLHFNIGKEKREGKKKQYTFEIHATFGVPESPELIACKLPSSILEPLFPLSPAALRALTRTDRPASNLIVEQGGTRIRQEFFGKLQPWQATLLTGATSLEDIHQPILMIQPIQP